MLSNAHSRSFFNSTSFSSTMNDLVNKFDQVFICASDTNTKLGLMALKNFAPGLVLFASLRKTRKMDVKNIKTSQPVDLLFYD